jgi:hypothetical protein
MTQWFQDGATRNQGILSVQTVIDAHLH